MSPLSREPTSRTAAVQTQFETGFSQPVVIRLRPRARQGIRAWILLLSAAGIGLVLLVMVLAGVVFAYGYYEFGNRIFPGVSTSGQDLGGMTAREAGMMLDRAWAEETMLLASNGIQSQNVAPVQLGITLDSERTVQNALTIGREGTLTTRFGQLVSALVKGRPVEPIVSLNLITARQGLEALTPSFSQPAVDASLEVQEGELVEIPPTPGYTININQTLENLQIHFGSVLATGLMPVVPEPVAPAITDVKDLKDDAIQMLDRPAAVQVYDPILDEKLSFAIPRARMAEWLQVSQVEGAAAITLDESGVASFLNEISGQLEHGRTISGEEFAPGLAKALRDGSSFWVSARHPVTRYTVQPGDTLLKLGWRLGIPFWMILNANPGTNPDQLIAGSELIIPSKNDLVPLPVVPNKRIIISLSKQRLTVFQDGKQIVQHVISTGIDRSPTQPGIFQVQTHDPNAYASVWDLYMPSFLGIYEAWPGFMNGIHGLPMLSSGRRMWANNLGRPSSYGCIILGLNEAEWLFEWAENGVIVEIRE